MSMSEICQHYSENGSEELKREAVESERESSLGVAHKSTYVVVTVVDGGEKSGVCGHEGLTVLHLPQQLAEPRGQSTTDHLEDNSEESLKVSVHDDGNVVDGIIKTPL